MAKLKLLLNAAALCAVLFIGTYARAQETEDAAKPADPDTGESTIQETTLGLLPNPLEQKGIKFAATYIGETLGNLSGGLKQGTIYEGRLNLAADINFEKLAGWQGLTFHTNVFQIHGDGLSRSYLKNLMVVSGIEALPTTRLYELYFDQKFLNADLSIRFGQLAADAEFLNSKYTDVFTNASLGWPAITSVDLPSGGPSPPLAVPGVRLRVKLSNDVTVLAAVFDGNAAGPGMNDPQLRDRYGLNFRVTDPPLLLGELQYGWNSGDKAQGLPGTLKIGGWQHFGAFDDQHFTAMGLSRANPAATGLPAQLQGNAGVYSVLEQSIYRVGDDKDRGVGVFARISSSPSDRNLIDLYADGGIELNGLADSRQHDKFGISAGYARISKSARALDQDYASYIRADWPTRNYEGLITAAYQYEVRSGWTLQPNAQYVIRPGGGATDPTGPTPGIKLKNATVMGVRTVLKF